MCWLLCISRRLTAKKAKAARISYLVVKEQNFEGISIRVFCGYSDFESVVQAPFGEFVKNFLRVDMWIRCPTKMFFIFARAA